MTTIERAGFERLVGRLLREADSVTVRPTKLARQGYDVAFLEEMADAYAMLPARFRQFAVTFDRAHGTFRFARTTIASPGAAAG